VAALPELGVKINFQPADAPVPAGYLADTGEPFAQRGDYAYGWNAANRNAVDRNLITDQVYDTFNFMLLRGAFIWEFALPAGRYTVRVIAGDPCCIDAIYHIAAEGMAVVVGQPTNETRWLAGQAQLEVTDGRLSVSSAPGAINNRLTAVEIYPAQ
jgi:hypothetical protein